MKNTLRLKAASCCLVVLFFISMIFAVCAQAGINNWFVRSNPSTNQLNKVVYENGLYVVVGGAGTIMTSTDGASWSLVSSGTTCDLYDVTYNGSMYIAVGGVSGGAGVILTSTNGQSWNVQTLPSMGIISNISYGNNTSVALVAGGTLTSVNGETWTYNPVDGGLTTFQSMTYGEGMFIACTPFSYSYWQSAYWIFTSVDGVVWNFVTNDSDTSYDTDPCYNVLSYANGTFFAANRMLSFMGIDAMNYIVNSPAGYNWSFSGLLGNSFLSEVAYGNGAYLTACSWNGIVYASWDKINWIQIPTGVSSGTFWNICYGNGSFIIVGSGAYGYGLIVQSQSDNPVANAGLDQTIHAGGMVTLDGSGSSDPNGYYPLTYSWSIFSTPAGSTAALSDPTAVNPSFTLDKEGTYTVELVVTNSYGNSSSPVYTIVSTINSAPVAEAGDDQAIIIRGMPIQLNGTQSYDPDGDPIIFIWNILDKPAGSAAQLSNAATATPTITPDVYGTYVIQLTVIDSWDEVGTDTVTLSFNNLKPIANAGQNQSLNLGDTSNLDGSGSTDPNGDYLSYMWSISSAPSGSTASISNPFTVQPSFIPDLPGTYVVSLMVNDGLMDSDPSNITILVTSNQTTLIVILQEAIDTTNGFSPSVFKNKNMANTITNKLNAVIHTVEQGQYESAMDKLQNDIIKKTDGCNKQGSPDNNDWIISCSAQSELYNLLIQVRNLLQGMI